MIFLFLFFPAAPGAAFGGVRRPHRIVQRPGVPQRERRVVAGVEGGPVGAQPLRLDARDPFLVRAEEDAVLQRRGRGEVLLPQRKGFQGVPRHIEDRAVGGAGLPHGLDQVIALVGEAFHPPFGGLVSPVAVVFGHFLRRAVVGHAVLADAPGLADGFPFAHRPGVAVVAHGHRQDARAVLLPVGGDPGPGRVVLPDDGRPVAPGLLLERHQVRPVMDMQDDGLVLVGDAPTENGGVVPVAEHHPAEVVLGVLPEPGVLQGGTAVAGPVRRLREDADAHFVGQVQVEAGIDLRMGPDGVAVHALDGHVPGPGIAAGELRDAHKMPGIAPERIRLPVQAQHAVLQGPFPPAEAFVFVVDGLFPLRQRELEGVQVGMLRRPGLEVRRDAEGLRQGVPGGNRKLHRRDIQRLLAQFPRWYGGLLHRFTRTVQPTINPARELDGSFPGAVIP